MSLLYTEKTSVAAYNMITLEEAHKNIKESLVGFPKEVTEAYLAFATKADMESLDKVVTGILQFYLAKAPKTALS